jgi:hypothetical protein
VVPTTGFGASIYPLSKGLMKNAISVDLLPNMHFSSHGVAGLRAQESPSLDLVNVNIANA